MHTCSLHSPVRVHLVLDVLVQSSSKFACGGERDGPFLIPSSSSVTSWVREHPRCPFIPGKSLLYIWMLPDSVAENLHTHRLVGRWQGLRLGWHIWLMWGYPLINGHLMRNMQVSGFCGWIWLLSPLGYDAKASTSIASILPQVRQWVTCR